MEVLATASEGVMGALADKLKALLRHEYVLQSGVRDDVRFLQSELQRMHAFLLDYARCQNTTALDKDRAREVQELAYDAEDAVDEFTHRVDGPAPVGIPAMVKHFVSKLMARRQIAKQLRDLRDRALQVSKRHKRYDLSIPSEDAPSPTTLQLPSTVYAETATNLVGIDGPRDLVMGKLTSARTKHSSGRRRVASMVGFAGVGKTTLAMAVYRSLEGQFQCRAFVNVSRKFDIRKVLKEILQQVMINTGNSSTPDSIIAGMEKWGVSQLVDKLRQNLKDKRYLITIDDLWEVSAWKDISRVLPENNLDSIIITTTRNESVANACCLRNHPGHLVHKVASLNYLDSRKLFLDRIFDSENNFPNELEEVSVKILKKCAGLPLAIVCISSLLAATASRPEVTKWEKIFNSLGAEIESYDGLRRLKQALKVGYDDLPQHLKVCLLYFSMFPEDCKIKRDPLTRRWIAEGFVYEKHGMGVQEVAESYFSELIERGLIQAVDIDCFGETHACRIHDVMFEVITMKAVEENFVTLTGDRGGTSTQQRNVRRLSLYCGTATDGLDWSSFNMPRIRSLTIYGDIGNLDSIPQYRYLRTLDFESCEGVNSRHLKNIGDLFLLKYLSLKSTWISELPQQIGELKCLETLDLTQTNVRELPGEITKLQRLVVLLAGGAELPQGVGDMRSLQILCIRAVSKNSKEAVKELLRLTNLRKIDITYGKRRSQNKSPDTFLPSIISKLGNCKLQSLQLNLVGYSIGMFLQLQFHISPAPQHLRRLRIRGGHGFQNVPMWISSLFHVIDLELTVRMMSAQDLEILAGLPRLVRFRLILKETSKKGIVITGSGFLSLKELFISCRIMPVSFSGGVMTKLKKFELQFKAYQEDLKFLDQTIEHLQFLVNHADSKEIQITTVIQRGLSDREVQHLTKAFMGAGFINCTVHE